MVVFQEKSDHFHNLALSVQEVCETRRLSTNFIRERHSADRNLSIETMVEDSDNVFSKRMESVYRGDSNIHIIIEQTRVRSFPSEESNTLSDSRAVFISIEMAAEILINELQEVASVKFSFVFGKKTTFCTFSLFS